MHACTQRDGGAGHEQLLPQQESESTVVVQQAEGSKVEVNIHEGATAQELAQRAADVDNAALDSILSLNSFFCVAIFIGISLPAQQGAAAARAAADAEAAQAPPAPCALADPESVRQTVLMLEIIAFACILSSTLFAVGLKMVLNMNANADKAGQAAGGGVRDHRVLAMGRTTKGDREQQERQESASLTFFRAVMCLSAAGLVAALVLLCISMVFYVELYAGRITCSARARKSTLPLIVFTGLGLLFLLLVLVMFIAWFRTLVSKCTAHLRKRFGLGKLKNQSLADAKDVESSLPNQTS